MGRFFQELRRRNVFRVGVAYVVVSWLILQVIETVSEPLGLPTWTEAFFIVLLATGLPLVLIFAWAFELTPEGLKKTKDVAKEESVTADTGKKLNYAIIAVLVIALGYFIWERQVLVEQSQSTAASAGDGAGEVVQTAGVASVAVLPFVNMSADPEQEYFSDGISEELLNLLAKIPELRVPARTSSFQFKGQNLDISEVARQLNVKHVLEGSVRKADVRIRVTAQLIEADTGYHLWSDTYDRELTDIFHIQDEISESIVAALSETLGLREESAPHVTSTDPEAYNAFLLGQHLIKKRTKTDIELAIPNYEKAVSIDPDYAPAHAGLGLAWHLLLKSRQTYGTLTLEESNQKAVPALERALALDSNLPEALGAMGLVVQSKERYEEAIGYFEKALATNPSQTDIRNWYSSSLTRLGRDEEALAQMERAYELDPLSVLTLNNYTNELLMRRQFDQVTPVLDRLTQVDPARGTAFRGFILHEQHREAEGTEMIFRAADLDGDSLRLRSIAAISLVRLGLIDDALQVWPFPNPLPIIAYSDDDEYALELAKAEFERDPTDPSNLEALAEAYYETGNTEQALRNARRYLDSLDQSRREIDRINWLFIRHALETGDQDLLERHLGPLESSMDKRLASGVDNTRLRFNRAIVYFIRGETQSSLDQLDVAFSRGIINAADLDRTYETLSLNELPAYVERRSRHDEYVRQERIKFLTVACGPDGFATWRPSPDICPEAESI